MDRLPTNKVPSGSPTPDEKGFNVPLIRDNEIIEQPAVQTTLTQRYTEEAVKIISGKKDKPFFIYLAHTFPHVPMFASPDFKGKSRGGIYGDAVEEIDWSVGRIMDALKEQGIAENTLVIFTSDNGPWLTQGDQGGSAGLLRDGKGSTWEGGMRVPGIMWMPGKISPRITFEAANAMDIFPTVLALAGSADGMPDFDGTDLSGLLFRDEKLPADRPFFYYRGRDLFACRIGQWKLHFKTQTGYGPGGSKSHTPPALYNLATDPSEERDVSAAHSDVIAKISESVDTHRKSIVEVPSQMK